MCLNTRARRGVVWEVESCISEGFEIFNIYPFRFRSRHGLILVSR